MDFQPGQKVTVRQQGTMTVGGATFTDNVFGNATIVKKNDDGTYQVKDIIATAEGDELTIPADWIEPEQRDKGNTRRLGDREVAGRKDVPDLHR